MTDRAETTCTRFSATADATMKTALFDPATDIRITLSFRPDAI